MGFVFVRKAVLAGCAGNSQSLAMDLHDQHACMEKTGQWRFTPPTHVLVALSEAMDQFAEEGGQPARLARYVDNCRTLVDGMARLGFKPFLRPEVQAPIIVTFHAPADTAYDFKRFYDAAKQRGFILYPGGPRDGVVDHERLVPERGEVAHHRCEVLRFCMLLLERQCAADVVDVGGETGDHFVLICTLRAGRRVMDQICEVICMVHSEGERLTPLLQVSVGELADGLEEQEAALLFVVQWGHE